MIVPSSLPRACLHVTGGRDGGTRRRDNRRTRHPRGKPRTSRRPTAPRHAGRFQPAAISTRRSGDTRNPRTHRPRQMARMGTPCLPHRKTLAMERTRHLRMDRPASRVTRRQRPSPGSRARVFPLTQDFLASRPTCFIRRIHRQEPVPSGSPQIKGLSLPDAKIPCSQIFPRFP